MQAAQGNWRTGLAMAIATAVLWGLLPIALKVALTGMDAPTITWWRFAFSMLALGLYLAWRGQLPAFAGVGRGVIGLLGLALAMLLANYLLYLVALDLTTPSVAQVVIQLAPLLLLLGGVFVFHERFAARQWVGFAVLAAGLLLFFNRRLPELLQPAEGLGLGVFLMVLAAVAWAAYGLLQKRLLRHFTSRQVLWVIYAGSAVVLLPVSEPATVVHLDGLQLAMLAFCCVNTLAAYGAFGEALHHWDVSRVSAVLATAPLVTIGAMWLVEHTGFGQLAPEGLNALAVAGALAVVGGSMLAALSSR